MGQYAASTTLHWALGRLVFPQCMSAQSYIEGESGCYILPSSSSKTAGTSNLFICTHILSLKNTALHSASFCTFCFINSGKYQMFTSHT